MTIYDAAGMPILPAIPPAESEPQHQRLATYFSDLIGFCIGGSPSHLAVSVIVSEVRRNATRPLKERLYVAERPVATAATTASAA